MRYFGSYNRNKGLFTESKDIMIYQKAREEDHQRRQEANLETDSDTHVGMWLLCHPDNDLATAMYSKLFLLQLEVTHDDVISWLGTAIRCHPSHLVPSGRALTIREKPTLSAELRVGYWNTGIGITQACLLMQYLGTCKLNKLSLDERANVLFAVLRIFGHCDEIAANPHAQQFLRLLYASGDRIQGIEAFASIFFQFSNAIRTLWKLTEDEPLVMRLTVEILMCLCQRPEIVATLPDFTMGDQMYCKQVKMIILDLTSDAHDQITGNYQREELHVLIACALSRKSERLPLHRCSPFEELQRPYCLHAIAEAVLREKKTKARTYRMNFFVTLATVLTSLPVSVLLLTLICYLFGPVEASTTPTAPSSSTSSSVPWYQSVWSMEPISIPWAPVRNITPPPDGNSLMNGDDHVPLLDTVMAQMYKEEALSQDHHAAEQRDLIERGFGIPVPGPSHRNDSLQNGGIHGEDDDEILDELNDEELAYEEDVEIGEDEEDEEEEVHANGDILPPPINEREEEEDDDDEIEEGAVVKLEVPDDGEYDSAKVAVD